MLSRQNEGMALAPGLEEVGQDPDFSGYTILADRGKVEIARLKSRGLIAERFSPREVFYSLGMGQALVLDQIQQGWKDRVFEEGTFLEDLLAKVAR